MADDHKTDRLVGEFSRLRVEALNSFCPTGEGGGIDPSCSPSLTPKKLSTIIKDAAKGVGECWNEGDCLTFVNIVLSKLGTDMIDVNEGYGPKGLSAEYAETAKGISHVFLKYKGKYYDAINYEGVKRKADLAFFKKYGPPVDNVFCPTGEGGGIDPSCSPSGKSSGKGKTPKNKKPPVVVGRPTRPEERVVGEDGAPPMPKAKKWKDPPPKTGKVGSGPIVRPKGEDSQTVRGDETEELAKDLGFRSTLPISENTGKQKRNLSAKEVEEQGSSIDVEYDHSGILYEVKMCQSSATEYRLKAKKEEKDLKMQYAETHKAHKVKTMVAVRDVNSGEVHFYVAKVDGLTGAEVSKDKYDYIGTVKPPKKEGE